MPGDNVFWSSRSQHKPPHVYVGGVAHMITASTLGHARLLRAPRRKELLVATMSEVCLARGITVLAWVVLDDHYHAVMVPTDAAGLRRALGWMHGVVATELNREDGSAGRQVWYSHWDRCLYTEGDLYSRINYCHRNPVKHGYVAEALDWPWSSYRSFLDPDDPEVAARLARFPAPRRLPGDSEMASS